MVGFEFASGSSYLIILNHLQNCIIVAKVCKKFGIVHTKRFLNHTEIDTTMKYLNIEDDMELIDYGL